ncbi:uncharacterized protein [Temnothorax nylanderi]|uniref:uncharacterized protein n=1 Tax=Temnothorax nylanderi TaxID=102681 RepID=UPI003A864DEB
MQILSLNFLMYTVGGIWRPVEWSSNNAKLLYCIFTFIMVSSEYFLMLTQCMDIVFVVHNINDFVNTYLLFMSVVAVCCKATVIVTRRNAIISLVQLLLKAPCKPRDEDEVAIQTKFDKFIRSWSIKYSLLCIIALTGVSIGSVLNIMQDQLPCQIWLPWDYNVPLVFWIICIQQLMCHIFTTIIGLGTDTLIFGLFIQTCAQIEIFESRLHKLIINNTVRYLGHALSPLNEDKTNISEIIRHHLGIYKYAKTVNDIFRVVLFIQFLVSTCVICISVYYLLMHITEPFEIGLFVAYTIGICVQIYIYCWSGNEVMLKSMGIGDAVYHMDWPLLSAKGKKELLMIMMRSSIPIKFTSSFLITLSLQSFKSILKTSYSAFNVLQKRNRRRDLNMQILSLHFSMYTVGGIWRPVEWSSDGAKLLYSIFTFIIVSSEYFLMITQFMDIVLVVDNIDDFTANTLMFLTIVAVCCKATVVVVRRNAIINIVQLLLKAPHKPRNEDEVAIQTKFDKFIRTFSLRYTFLATGSITGLTLGSILNAMHGHLPYRVWLPWNYNIPLVFWIISIHQILTLIFACIINVGTETLVLGLLIQTCAQLEIFESRLHKFIINKTVRDLGRTLSTSNKNEVGISECVHYHLSIYRYAKTVNVIFNQVLFVQFFCSIIVLCTCVYYLSTHTAELSGLVSFLVYTICMFAQIFVYCWSGNEVILKSTSIGDTIYRMDWPLLSIREKKGLLMIMMRSTIPIKFTSSFLITLSLQSYSNILKTSYSVFNVLQK